MESLQYQQNMPQFNEWNASFAPPSHEYTNEGADDESHSHHETQYSHSSWHHGAENDAQFHHSHLSTPPSEPHSCFSQTPYSSMSHNSSAPYSDQNYYSHYYQSPYDDYFHHDSNGFDSSFAYEYGNTYSTNDGSNSFSDAWADYSSPHQFFLHEQNHHQHNQFQSSYSDSLDSEKFSFLESHLNTRPSIHQLVKNNIIKFPNISPALIPQTERLLWEQRKCQLQIRISQRPSKESLVHRMIIPSDDSSQATDDNSSDTSSSGNNSLTTDTSVQLSTHPLSSFHSTYTTQSVAPDQQISTTTVHRDDVLERMDAFFRKRPALKELVQRHILYSTSRDPYVCTTARKIDQELVRCSLLGALSQRPSLQHMRQRGLLNSDD